MLNNFQIENKPRKNVWKLFKYMYDNVILHGRSSCQSLAQIEIQNRVKVINSPFNHSHGPSDAL